MQQNPLDRADTRHKSDHIHVHYSDGALIAAPPMHWLEGATIHTDRSGATCPRRWWRHLPSPLVAPPGHAAGGATYIVRLRRGS